jgi:hypothetical protein
VKLAPWQFVVVRMNSAIDDFDRVVGIQLASLRR